MAYFPDYVKSLKDWVSLCASVLAYKRKVKGIKLLLLRKTESANQISYMLIVSSKKGIGQYYWQYGHVPYSARRIRGDMFRFIIQGSKFLSRPLISDSRSEN